MFVAVWGLASHAEQHLYEILHSLSVCGRTLVPDITQMNSLPKAHYVAFYLAPICFTMFHPSSNLYRLVGSTLYATLSRTQLIRLPATY